MSRLTPYLGSLQSPKVFSRDYDEGRRYEFRGFGHLLVLLGIVGLASGFARSVLTASILIGLVTLLRGYMPARSSSEWAEPDPEMEAAEHSPQPAVRFFAKSVPFIGILLIIGFGLSLAGFLTETKLFMVGLVGMFSTAAAFILLVRRD